MCVYIYVYVCIERLENTILYSVRASLCPSGFKIAIPIIIIWENQSSRALYPSY